MIFSYEAINKKGQIIRNIIEAQSIVKAKAKLKEDGLYVKSISLHDKKTLSSSDSSLITRYAEKISHGYSLSKARKQIPVFSRQLSTLLRAGMPLSRALSDIVDQTDNAYFKLVLADIKQKLDGGTALSAGLAQHGDVFDEMYVNMIKIGESMGSLDMVVERLADEKEKQDTLKSSIMLALYYPLFMFVFTCLVMIILLIFVVPTISEMFSQIGKELPLPTRIVIGTSSFLIDYWFVILIVLVVFGFMFKRYINTSEGRKKYDSAKFKIPLFKHFYAKLVVLRFCQGLGLLLQNGVEIIRSLEIVKKSVENTIIEKKISEASSNVKEGASISKALTAADFLPKMVTGMISVGESSDTLAEMLLKIGILYQQEVDRQIQTITKLVEPAMIMIMGGIIGLIAISIILPVVELNLSFQ